MQREDLAVKATLMALAVFIFVFLYLGYKVLRGRKRLDENDENLLYGGFIDRDIFAEGEDNPDQVGGYAGPGVVNNDPSAEWI